MVQMNAYIFKYNINVVTQFLAGNFYCQIGIYNAESMFCQNLISLGQIEAEIMTDFVFYQKVIGHSVSYQKVVCQ